VVLAHHPPYANRLLRLALPNNAVYLVDKRQGGTLHFKMLNVGLAPWFRKGLMKPRVFIVHDVDPLWTAKHLNFGH